jgi:Fe-S cluster assembly ATPase SufC
VKKFILTVIVILFLGCTNSASLLGTWSLDIGTDIYKVVFGPNGKGQLIINTDIQKMEYEVNNTTITMEAIGDIVTVEYSISADGKKLTLRNFLGIKNPITFAKE